MPESILGECKTHTAADGSAVGVLSQSRRMAAFGLRVLAVAYGPSLDELTLAGIVGLEGVPQSVANIERSDVKVLMVTGDSKETAVTIARRCSLIRSQKAANSSMDSSDGSSNVVSSNKVILGSKQIRLHQIIEPMENMMQMASMATLTF